MTGPLRPKFNEGQVLGAADLNAQVTYDVLGSVLHERTEHLWGVAQGLALTTTPNKDSANKPYVDVSLSPGRAVDRLGRSIVATTAIPLDPGMFVQQVANRERSKLYPVFVQALYVEKAGETQPGKCSVNLTTRIEESLQISFGNPGSELAILDQEAATVDEGFGTQTLTDKVLVGWVQFDPDISNHEGKFVAVASQANETNIRYVGVVASDVVAGGGVLTLHTRPDGQRFVLSVSETPTGGCVLAFGKQDGSNPVAPTFTVDEKGNVTYTGALSPSPPAKTLAESGFAYDGVKLPLPATVSEDDVTGKKVRLHILVTPVPQVPTSMQMPDGHTIVAFPFVEECSVDPTTRVLTSSIRWIDPAHPTTNYVIVPNACNYVLVASGE